MWYTTTQYKFSQHCGVGGVRVSGVRVGWGEVGWGGVGWGGVGWGVGVGGHPNFHLIHRNPSETHRTPVTNPSKRAKTP